MITKTTIEKLKNKAVLTDVNFLFDILRYREKYYPVLKQFKDNKIDLVTISPVLIEYYKGTNTKENLKIKKDFFDASLAMVYPIEENILENSFKISIAFRSKGKDLSATDLFLAGTLKKFKEIMVLLTRDHSDFPTNLFNRFDLFVVELESELRTYSFIQYSEEKYITALDNFNKTI